LERGEGHDISVAQISGGTVTSGDSKLSTKEEASESQSIHLAYHSFTLSLPTGASLSSVARGRDIPNTGLRELISEVIKLLPHPVGNPRYTLHVKGVGSVGRVSFEAIAKNPCIPSNEKVRSHDGRRRWWVVVMGQNTCHTQKTNQPSCFPQEKWRQWASKWKSLVVVHEKVCR
jgi:hypothetical protein